MTARPNNGLWSVRKSLLEVLGIGDEVGRRSVVAADPKVGINLPVSQAGVKVHCQSVRSGNGFGYI